jgi:hypothetical protein
MVGMGVMRMGVVLVRGRGVGLQDLVALRRVKREVVRNLRAQAKDRTPQTVQVVEILDH